MKRNIVLAGLILMLAYTLSHIYVFITAWKNPFKSTLVVIDHYNEALIELIILFISFPLIGLSSYLIYKESYKKNVPA